MSGLIVLIPVAVCLGLLALAAFLWALRSGQYEDLEGAGQRILDDERSSLTGIKDGRRAECHQRSDWSPHR